MKFIKPLSNALLSVCFFLGLGSTAAFAQISIPSGTTTSLTVGSNYDFSLLNNGNAASGYYQGVVNGYDVFSVAGSYSDLAVLLTNQPWFAPALVGKSYPDPSIGAWTGSLALAMASAGGNTDGNFYFMANNGPWANGAMYMTRYHTGSLSNTNLTNSFNWMVTSDIAGGFASTNSTAGNIAGSPNTGVAPEIDGSLAPKVGFLLGCLFLMFGRKKQNTESLLSA